MKSLRWTQTQPGPPWVAQTREESEAEQCLMKCICSKSRVARSSSSIFSCWHTLLNFKLTVTTQEKDLGVTVDSSLKTSAQMECWDAWTLQQKATPKGLMLHQKLRTKDTILCEKGSRNKAEKEINALDVEDTNTKVNCKDSQLTWGINRGGNGALNRKAKRAHNTSWPISPLRRRTARSVAKR